MIVWIHGAFSSSNTFCHFRVDDWGEEHLIDYDSSGDLISTVISIGKHIESVTNGPIDIVGHSLGGVIGVALQADGLKVRSIVTLAAPFGGIGPFWPKGTIGYEMRRLMQFTTVAPTVPHQFYVSTEGHNPWFLVPNDGVVPIRSQKFIPNANYIEVKSNHFQIMANNEVIENVREFHSQLNGTPQAIRASGKIFT